MITKEMRELIIHELPEIVKQDEEIHQLILYIASGKFADKMVTESRFDRMLDELRQNREEQQKRWEEQETRWAENQKRWAENQQAINRTLDRLEQVDKRIDQSIGALGARWGLQSEEAFRNGLKAILEDSFEVEVIRVNEWDDTGMVFGRPDQIELDIIVRNGQLIICELKSSMSKADLYTFERKVRYYEKIHQRTCHRMLVISPMVDEGAKKVAQDLGVEVYTHSRDVSV